MVLPLNEFVTETEVKLFKMDLEKKIVEDWLLTANGELLVSLLYNETLGRLSVTVIEAKNLKVYLTFYLFFFFDISIYRFFFQFKNIDKQDSYVRITLNQNYKAIKVKKTSVVRGKNDPSFFECFNFRLTPATTDVSSLCFEVFQCVSGYGRGAITWKKNIIIIIFFW